MDNTTLKIAIAAFMHDIGKFADKSTLKITGQYLDDNVGTYLPVKKGRYSHYHAVYTAAFIEYLQADLPEAFNRPGWGDGDAFINLAARHHDPETPMQWIITVADRIGSGWDRDKFDEATHDAVAWQDYKKTRLVPIFEKLSVSKDKPQGQPDVPDDYAYAYPLKPLCATAIFPGLKNKTEPGDKRTANEDYQLLFDGFISNLKALRHREDNLLLWFEHFDSLMMRYTGCIPAARAGQVIPDVSLYDHSKITSALATAMFLYHRDQNSLTIKDIQNETDKKFLIINGDFQGIQNFIFGGYGDTRKFRSKILRGRSFAVSLLSELAADMLCRDIGLAFSSVILNAAGKFTILAPNTEQTKRSIIEVKKAINDWLIRISYGETVINISHIEASCGDFTSGKFITLWDDINAAMGEKKFDSIDLDQYGGAYKAYLAAFKNTDHPLCPICGKRPSAVPSGRQSYIKDIGASCNLCRDHIFMGTHLVKKNRLIVFHADTAAVNPDQMLHEPIFGKYQITFTDDAQKIPALPEDIVKYWNLSPDLEADSKSDVAVKLINGYVPKYGPEDELDLRIQSCIHTDEEKNDLTMQINSQDPKTLNHIACMARTVLSGGTSLSGIEALGILKADVDRLGLLMACGLPDHRITLSRMATLSRQFDAFFSVYLPHFLKTTPEFRDVYTVFAGGDDMFLIGPWNRIIDLSIQLRDSFSDYVCKNTDIHFSAGITLHKAHTPIDALARAAEDALETSKSSGRDRLTLFSETAPWDRILQLTSIGQTFENWLDQQWISRVMFYRLNEFIDMAAKEKQLGTQREIPMADMACTKWRALLAYNAERNIASRYKDEERRKIVTHVTEQLTHWIQDFGGTLRIPLWTVLYNRR